MEFVERTPWIVVALLLTTYLLIRSMVLQGGLYLFITRVKIAAVKRVYRLPFLPGQYQSEIKATLLTILIDGTYSAALLKWAPFSRNVGDVLPTFVLSFVWFEIWFYASHRLLHLKAFYFIHRQHHVAKVTSAFTATSFSALERFVFLSGGLGVLALLAWVIPISPFGLAGYLLANHLLNLFGHSNVELVPPATLNSSLGRVFNTPTYHSLHHGRYEGHFGLFTPYMDSLFGSSFPDYRQIQKNAYEGKGLTSLSQ